MIVALARAAFQVGKDTPGPIIDSWEMQNCAMQVIGVCLTDWFISLESVELDLML